MRRFNLTKPATAGDPDGEAVPEVNTAPPSRRRVFLLTLLLIAVVALGVKNFIATYVGRESGTPSPATGRTVGPPAEQVSRPSPAPQMPTAVANLERSSNAPSIGGAAEPGRTSKSPPRKKEDEESIKAGAAQATQPSVYRVPKAALRGRFSVQVGAMAREANALALSQRLEKLGYAVTIRQRRSPSTQHVVLVEGPSDKSGADAMLERLKAEGVSAIVGKSDGHYLVEAGRSVALDQAIDLAHELQKKGFTPKIGSEPSTNTLYMVRVGEFTSRSEAVGRAKELREKGFSVLIVRN